MITFDDYRQFVYGLTQECFVRTDLNLNEEKTAYISTLKFMEAQSVNRIENDLLERGFTKVQEDKLIYQIQIVLSE